MLMVTMPMRDIEGGEGEAVQSQFITATRLCKCVSICVHDFTSICLSVPLKQAVSFFHTLLAQKHS